MTAKPHKQVAQGGTALLIIDMINAFDFTGADRLLTHLDPVVDAILALRDEADRAKVPIVYVNDNYGQWHSDRERIIDQYLEQPKGRGAVERLRPRHDDYFVIKPQFSGFYATNLPVLLPQLGASKLVLTGIASDICVLFTAADAHMRDYKLWVPADATASETADRHRWALKVMVESMDACTEASADLTLDGWLARP